jgi:hypothetical protein
MTKTNQEILTAINELKVNIWSNSKRPDDVNGGCEYCGKAHGKNPLYVHITVAGLIVPNSITEEDLKQVGEESQGCFPIGSTCAKKLFGSNINLYTSK